MLDKLESIEDKFEDLSHKISDPEVIAEQSTAATYERACKP